MLTMLNNTNINLHSVNIRSLFSTMTLFTPTDIFSNVNNYLLNNFMIFVTFQSNCAEGLHFSAFHSVCHSVCLSRHAILAVRAIKSIMKDTIVLSARFEAILKWRFS